MKKTISFKTLPDKLQLLCDEVEFLSIPKDNLTIDGKKLFDSFVSKLDTTTKVEFDYVGDLTITDSNEKRIVFDIKTVLNTIAQKINEKFKLLTEDADLFFEDGNHSSEDAEENLPF